MSVRPSARPNRAAHYERSVQTALVSDELAIVSLTGAHDRAWYEQLRGALDEATVHGDVLVDLTRCSSLDACAIGALIAANGAATAQGHRLALLIDAEPCAVTDAVESARLSEIMSVHTSRRAVFASFTRLSRP